MSDESLQQAIGQTRNGKKDSAREILTRIVQRSPENESAWLWLAETYTDNNQRIAVLERCLQYNPQSRKAQEGLKVFRSRSRNNLQASESGTPSDPSGLLAAQEKTSLHQEQTSFMDNPASKIPVLQKAAATIKEVPPVRPPRAGPAQSHQSTQAGKSPRGSDKPQKTSCMETGAIAALTVMAIAILLYIVFFLKGGTGGPADAHPTLEAVLSELQTQNAALRDILTGASPTPSAADITQTILPPTETAAANIASPPLSTLASPAISPENASDLRMIAEVGGPPAGKIVPSSAWDILAVASHPDAEGISVVSFWDALPLTEGKGSLLPYILTEDEGVDTTIRVTGEVQAMTPPGYFMAIAEWCSQCTGLFKSSVLIWSGIGYEPYVMNTGGTVYAPYVGDNRVLSLAISGTTVAVANSENVILWSEFEEVEHIFENRPNCTGLAFAGPVLVTGCLQGGNTAMVTLWNTDTYAEILATNKVGDVPTRLAVASGGTVLAFNIKGAVVLWDMTTGQDIRTFATEGQIESLVFSPDGSVLAGGASDGSILLWDVARGNLLKTLEGPKNIAQMSFSPDGRFLLVANETQPPQLWGLP
jgi:hypothetical protein